MRDDELRGQLAAWIRPVAEGTVPPPVSVIRRRARRRVARITVGGLTALAAIAAIVLTSLPAPARHPRAPRPVTPVTRPISLTAPYAVLVHGFTDQAPTVVDMATGKVLVKVQVPKSAYLWAVAAADDRTFVLAADSETQVYRFYLLQLASNGQPHKPTLLRVPQLHEAQIYGMALTADGSELAIAWQNVPIGPERYRIQIVSLATGATRTWSSTEGSAFGLSWDGDRILAFEWQDNTGEANSGIRLLDTSAPGTDPLASSRLLIPYSTGYAGLNEPSNPVVTPDGSAIFALMSNGPATDPRIAIVKFSASTGKPLAVLTRPASMNGPQAEYCGVLWTDRTGQHLLTQCGTTQDSVTGTRFTRIRLHLLLPDSVIGYADTFAW